jgi:hypothetical protein
MSRLHDKISFSTLVATELAVFFGFPWFSAVSGKAAKILNSALHGRHFDAGNVFSPWNP